MTQITSDHIETWGSPCTTTDDIPSEERRAEFVKPERNAADALRRTCEQGRCSDVRMTPEGNKVVKARVGPWMAFKMLFTGYIHPVNQLRYKHMLADYDTPAVDPVAALVDDEDRADQRPDAVERVRKAKHCNRNWWAGYSLLAHAHFHSPRYTRATEMQVSAWIRKSMEADHVRRIQIASVLPMAVRMAFVPTESDVDAQAFDNAPATRVRYRRKETSYWSAWFSRRRGHYESDQ